MKYLYQIGDTQTYIYNKQINQYADDCGGRLTHELINRLTESYRSQLGVLFEVYFDELALLSYFMEREGVDIIKVVEKTPLDKEGL